MYIKNVVRNVYQKYGICKITTSLVKPTRDAMGGHVIYQFQFFITEEEE